MEVAIPLVCSKRRFVGPSTIRTGKHANKSLSFVVLFLRWYLSFFDVGVFGVCAQKNNCHAYFLQLGPLNCCKFLLRLRMVCVLVACLVTQCVEFKAIQVRYTFDLLVQGGGKGLACNKPDCANAFSFAETFCDNLLMVVTH